MSQAAGVTSEHRFRLELIEITRKLAPEKLGIVLESLSPTGMSELTRDHTEKIIEVREVPRTKGKVLLEKALSIFK